MPQTNEYLGDGRMPTSNLNIRTKEAPDFRNLVADGYQVSSLFLNGYFDGFSVKKTINGKTVEVYVGSDNGELYFTPQAYIDDSRVGEAKTVEQAARIAEFRALMPRTKFTASHQC